MKLPKLRLPAFISQSFSLIRRLGLEFRSKERLAQRILDDAETVLSVGLAIGFAHLVGADNVGWAAFSGYMVMRTQLADSLSRGVLRVLGTLIGAAAAWLLLRWVGHSTLLMSLALALLGGGTLYAAITRPHSYAWLFISLTFSIVTLDAIKEPVESVHLFAQTRILEVVSGTAACLIVNLIFAWTLRPRVHGPQYLLKPAQKSAHPVWDHKAALHAVQAGIGMGLLPLLVNTFGAELLTQAAITIIVVMLVPRSALEQGAKAVTTKVLHRFAGCLLGAAMAATALIFSHGNVAATLVFMAMGVAAGRHIENSGQPFADIGTQFALVFLVVFVPDNYDFVSSSPGRERFSGIVLGVLILVLVRGCGRWLVVRRHQGRIS